MDRHTIEITDTAYGGYGVGRINGGKVAFVPYTVEGDTVNIINIEDKGKFFYAKLLSVEKPSPFRVAPHCQYHGICGGCHFGHIAYETQLNIKKRFITQSFRKFNSILPDIEVISSKDVGYRIRTMFRLFNGTLGFFKSRSNELIAIDSCPILNSSLFNKAQKFAQKNIIDHMISLSVISNEKNESIAYLNGHDVPMLFKSQPFDGLKTNKDPSIGLDFLEFDFDGSKVAVDYDGFFQSNGLLNKRFRTLASSLVPMDSEVVELYAGSGFFTSALVKRSDNVRAIELNRVAASLGRHYGYPIASGHVIAMMDGKSDIGTLFIDPAREGVDKHTMNHILQALPDVIIYVSCNPTTLGRDILKLAGKYHIDKMYMIDMFPHTYHVETVVRLNRINKQK